MHTSQIPSGSLLFGTPVASITAISNPFPTEEEIKQLGWDIYRTKEQELRYLLHIEYLGKYIEEGITPKGLSINLRPSIQDDDLKEKWNEILRSASTDLMKLLIKHYGTKLEKNAQEQMSLRTVMDQVWDEEYKDNMVYDISEFLQPKEKELRKKKDRKLERDIRLKRSRNTPRPTPQKGTQRTKYSDIVRRHIHEQLRKPSDDSQEHPGRIQRNFNDYERSRPQDKRQDTPFRREHNHREVPEYQDTQFRKDHNYQKKPKNQDTHSQRDRIYREKPERDIESKEERHRRSNNRYGEFKSSFPGKGRRGNRYRA